MLETLSIKNFILVDNLTIDFSIGLNVLTGETGAGKTIILEALGLVLGNRADSNLFKDEKKESSINASFSINIDHEVSKILKKYEIEFSDTLIIRRSFGFEGRSKAFINDEHITIGALKEIGQSLVAIQNQKDISKLYTNRRQRDMLDQFADNSSDLSILQRSYMHWKDQSNEFDELKSLIEKLKKENEYYIEAINEIESLNLEDNEEVKLVELRNSLKSSDKINTTLREIHSILLETGGINEQTNRLEKIYSKLPKNIGNNFDLINESIERISIEAEEMNSLINTTINNIEFSDIKLSDVEDRLYLIREISRKNSCSSIELLALSEKYKNKLNSFNEKQKELVSKEKNIQFLRQKYESSVLKVSKIRKEASIELADRVNKELPPIKLENAYFEINISQIKENEWGLFGKDIITFMARTNPSSEILPIDQIASGGEISRFMLAIQVVLSRKNNFGVLIFDEADSGIGGPTADAVGRRLDKLSKFNQVIVITHSPQVAVIGDKHFKIFKTLKNNSAYTNIKLLNKNERVEEVARMLSGEKVTNEARAAALRLFTDTLKEFIENEKI
ncbi:DNA repair protein RecN [Alphaproteobacteria bacterium]|nr:DNA repair protein RecN [Alphaproteobacteria bacterium]